METKISIHALRKESDDRENSARFFDISFQSTLSVRRATWQGWRWIAEILISIHALRKESDVNGRRYRAQFMISIHALRKESDASANSMALSSLYFNPRSP